MTGIITISEAEFQAMPPSFDGAWLRDQFPSVAQSMDRFIDKVRDETNGELVGPSRSCGSRSTSIGRGT